MVYYKSILISGILMIYSLSGFSQTADWNLVDGKAIAEKKLPLPGKSQGDIYKEVYRWLIKVYKNPEDILKVRLENEYLHGQGYYADCVKFGAMASADLQYSFAFEIKNEEVTCNIFSAFLLFSYKDDGMHPVENYLPVKRSERNMKNEHDETVLASLNAFSNSLFGSLENHLIVK